MECAVIYYETQFKKGSKWHPYRTKSLTPTHDRLRAQFKVDTVKCDTSIPWVFGIWAEVVAKRPS